MDEEMVMLEVIVIVWVLVLNIGMEVCIVEIVGSCYFLVGNLWKCLLVKLLLYGGIGVKFLILSCWGVVLKIFIRLYVYMYNGWIWVLVIKVFESYGMWNME